MNNTFREENISRSFQLCNARTLTHESFWNGNVNERRLIEMKKVAGEFGQTGEGMGSSGHK